ncbi:YafY family protein [Demequina sp. NBRC 110055]|uniref:helix-turn-helix transcriptional regulator n=1 Tax=Demequina sp. NBRC 110055 TaxID=1570344 RepID=UPI0013563184|nr:WYL domain-containing protein [Demequina sp. NBRC 110055]
MADKTLARLTRLLGLVHYLERHGETEFTELADHFGVSVKQIRADVETLWVSGLPGHQHNDLIDFNADLFDAGIADLTNGQGVSQVSFSPREAAALIGALSALTASGAAPQAAESVLTKLRGAVGPVGLDVVPDTAVDPKVREALEHGIATDTAVALDYVDAHDRRTERTVEAHRIVLIDAAAYVECWCRRAGDYRTLRLDRVTSATTTTSPTEHPPADSHGFALQPHYEATVVLGRVARWAVEDMPGVSLTTGDDGTVTATFGVANPAWTAGRLLAIGPDLVSVEPQALREEIATQAQAVLDAQAR